jgi:hypothetical protein
MRTVYLMVAFFAGGMFYGLLAHSIAAVLKFCTRQPPDKPEHT